MAYCRKCGKLLSDNANHCTVCGAPVKSQTEKFNTGRIPHISIPPHDDVEETRLGRPSNPQQPPQYPPQNYSPVIPLGRSPQQPQQPQQEYSQDDAFQEWYDYFKDYFG